MAIKPGSKAPDFTLKTKTSDDTSEITLSDNFGKQNTVLLFFPLAFTSVCTQEFCDVSGGLSAYTDLDAAVYGISVDSPFSQQAWAEKHQIKIPLLSDLNKKTAEAYDVLLKDLMGFGSVSARAAFVIDRHGRVAYSEQTASPKNLPDFEAVQETLKKLSEPPA